ncbi:pyridoxal 5'-phosphate synthase glutaminase subunit PdxT [Effusibacillus lacus]|uniref:Pyridoxal 5'-phosphate synthase subunit PdxT n=1 Tax=Effusibacillus lacus TaxID=1348429 RepID=A0A292YJQ0_9BACL|nr:pyridoxal 5'-phosphate synthase glutaminase subunit PdxT [Effusibacillus lacus]TCS74417.1 5'-phosphate synthase pdxT subunit [Effusibacillus lacus]GAX88710.1 glutamine amidotransferase subunit PdxT [Effusibacillus lacus]
MKIGVLALQGAVTEHIKSLRQAGAEEVVAVKRKEDLADLDGLVLPGGESTTIGKLMNQYELMEPIREMAKSGTPMFGTCAGLILLANRIHGQDWAHLGVMDALVDRNSFGRQRESFETDLTIKGLEGEPYRAVFIRAPHIMEVGPGVEILSTYQNRIVAARQDNLLGTSFHPELTDDVRLHQYFVDMVRESVKLNS